MKFLFLVFAGIISTQVAEAQLKATAICPPFTVDVMDGNVNMIYPKSAIAEVQTTFPCTSEMVDENVGKCGGVFFKDKDVHFYTERDYIEIGERFKGKINPALMGVSRNNLFKLLGMPKLKDTNWEAFQMGYGTLVLYYNKAGKINKLQISSKSTDALKLCE
ncbi:MAG TPA: hypothetical protein VK484_07545 [Ferruginibacter sp.]|nr:hypothetical protein [Ferruginibacter sp.]